MPRPTPAALRRALPPQCHTAPHPHRTRLTQCHRSQRPLVPRSTSPQSPACFCSAPAGLCRPLSRAAHRECMLIDLLIGPSCGSRCGLAPQHAARPTARSLRRRDIIGRRRRDRRWIGWRTYVGFFRARAPSAGLKRPTRMTASRATVRSAGRLPQPAGVGEWVGGGGWVSRSPLTSGRGRPAPTQRAAPWTNLAEQPRRLPRPRWSAMGAAAPL